MRVCMCVCVCLTSGVLLIDTGSQGQTCEGACLDKPMFADIPYVCVCVFACISIFVRTSLCGKKGILSGPHFFKGPCDCFGCVQTDFSSAEHKPFHYISDYIIKHNQTYMIVIKKSCTVAASLH